MAEQISQEDPSCFEKFPSVRERLNEDKEEGSTGTEDDPKNYSPEMNLLTSNISGSQMQKEIRINIENLSESQGPSPSAKEIAVDTPEDNSRACLEISDTSRITEVMTEQMNKEDFCFKEHCPILHRQTQKHETSGTDAAGNLLKYFLETNPLPSDSKNGPILDGRTIRNIENSISLDTLTFAKESSMETSRENSSTCVNISDPVNSKKNNAGKQDLSRQKVCTEGGNTFQSPDNFLISSEDVLQSVRQVEEHMGTSQTNSTGVSSATGALNGDHFRSYKIQEDSAFCKPSVSSVDLFPKYRVSVPDEAGIASGKDEVPSNIKYETNLRKFLKESESKHLTLETEVGNSKRENPFLKKTFRSDSSFLNILQFCGAVTSILRKMKIGRKSKSAPPSFNPSADSDEPKLTSRIHLKTGMSSQEIDCKFLNISDGQSEERGLTEGLKDEAIDLVKPELTTSEFLDTDTNLQPLSELPGSSFKRPSSAFKVPVLPKVIGKSPKHSPKVIPSSDTNKIPREDRERSSFEFYSPRRPSDFNVSPRRAVYSWCPNSPTGFFRHCRSLPNISQPPRKDFRRASINFQNHEINSSVKALFTGEMKPKTPESSRSSVDVDNATRQFLLSQSKDEQQKTSPEQSSDLQQCSESSDLNVTQLSVKNKIRKKLIFVSHTCENTNDTPTLQDSSTLRDISGNISEMTIDVGKKESGPEISLIESSPKRKYLSPDTCTVPAIGTTKKLRFSHGCDSSGMSEKPHEEVSRDLCEDDTHALSENSDQSKAYCSTESRTDSLSKADSSEDLNVQTPVIEFPEEDLDERNSIRASLKRTQVMSSDVVEDITDAISDPKKKKEYE